MKESDSNIAGEDGRNEIARSEILYFKAFRNFTYAIL